MAECQLPKLDTRVRFPSPAFTSEEYSIPRVAKRARPQTLSVAAVPINGFFGVADAGIGTVRA